MARTRGKEKFKSDAARAALLDAGLQTLLDRGLAPGLDRVTLQEAIQRSGVPRTTAYRVFDRPGGARSAFHSALLERIQLAVDAEPSFDLVANLLAGAGDVLASGDGAAKADLFREMIRVGFNDRVQLLLEAIAWRAYVSTIVALMPGEPTEIPADAADAGERFVPLFEAMGEIFGFRPKPNLGWSGFANIMVAAVDGSVLRTLEDHSFASIDLDGDPERPWSGASVLALSLFLIWCEPDPDVETPADLATWTAFE